MVSKQLFTAFLNYPVPAELKSLPNINLFKSKIRHWECTEFPSKLCKNYLKIQVMFNISSKSIKHCNEVMRVSELFHLQVFLYRMFLYVKLQSSIKDVFQDSHKTSEIELLKKQTKDVAYFQHYCLDLVLNPSLNFSRC